MRSAEICEVASAAARYKDLSSDLAVVFDQQHAAAAFAALDGAEQSSGTAAYDDHIKLHLFQIAFVEDIYVVPDVADRNAG